VAGSDWIAVIPPEWLRDADHRLHDRGASRAPDLTRLGEATSPSRLAPARGPPLWEMPDAGKDPFDPQAQPAPDYECDQRIARGRDSLTRIRSRSSGAARAMGHQNGLIGRFGGPWAVVPGVAILARFSGSVGTQLPNDDCCQGQHCPDTCRSGVGPPILFRIHGARLALAPLHEAVDVGYPGPDDDLVAGFRRSAADASAGQLLRGS